jgi:flagellar basal-body rod protein FlgG
MLTELVRQDALSSDLANASTPGYKPENVTQASFGDVLIANSQTGQVLGSVGAGAEISNTSVNMTQGALQSTGQPLDVALQGPGFLTVQSANGKQYTRDGQLAVDAQGRLTTATGDPVLGTDGKPISIGAHSGDLKIASDGAVTAGGKQVGTLDVVALASPAKIGDNLFSGTPGAKPAGTTVEQGSLEGSAVNPATVMLDMIVSLRAYEASQKVIHSIDETLSRGIDSAGSVNS